MLIEIECAKHSLQFCLGGSFGFRRVLEYENAWKLERRRTLKLFKIVFDKIVRFGRILRVKSRKICIAVLLVTLRLFVSNVICDIFDIL